MEDEVDEVSRAHLIAAVTEGLAQSMRGESAPIDFAELKRELRAKLNRSD